jgi:transposase
MTLLELFCAVDDFWLQFKPVWHRYLLESGTAQRLRPTQLCESEMMTILIRFHESRFRDFKAYYAFVTAHQAAEFPKLVSYERFVQLMPRVGVALYVYLHLCQGTCTGISFIDSTPLRVCHNKRIKQHRVFDGFAERGKTTMGWFFGFKLHSVVNHHGELVAFDLTAGNVDDRQPLDGFQAHLVGKLFGDKGYLSKPLRDDLREMGIDLITTLRRNMKPQIMPLEDRLLLRKRAVIESIHNIWKSALHIDHTRHRSVDNFVVNLLAGLIAYCHRPDKPVVHLPGDEIRRLPTA